MKRWWGIRHVRYGYLKWRVIAWAQQMASIGIGLGGVNQSDIDYLNAIWRGDR